MDTSDLSARHKSVLAFIIEYQQQHHIAPSVREIGARLGLRSPAGVHRILRILMQRGYLLADAARKRSWRFAGKLPGQGIPLLGAIAAGQPIEALEYLEEELAVAPELFGCDKCFGLRVKGDSMIDAHILDGDLAIIRPQPSVANGVIAAVLVQDLLPEATLKIVRRTRTTLTLAPANAAYSALVFKGRQRKQVSIIGQFVGIVRKA